MGGILIHFESLVPLITIDHVTEVGSKQRTTVATPVTMWLFCISFEYFIDYYHHMPLAILSYLFARTYNTFVWGLNLKSQSVFNNFVCLSRSYIFPLPHILQLKCTLLYRKFVVETVNKYIDRSNFICP
jgi:hypothetical protein